jgi:methenyltetrahydromethanopterin cyclohydrolase
MQDGTIVVKGKCAGRAGAGMTGGKIVIMGSLPEILSSFTYTEMREKVKFGKEKIAGSFYVYTGDILEEGEGKIFVSRCRNRHLNPVDEIFPEPNLSVNKSAMPFVEKMIKEQQKIGVEVSKHKSGATIIDAGVKAKGSEEAGILVTLICLGGLADISIRNEKFGTLELPTLYEKMKGHPATATLGSQFAGWAVKTEDFYSLGSGPARAISMQPRKLYEKLCYRDNTDVAVLMLESDKMPTESAIEYIARESNVPASKLYLIVASTSSIVGSVQIAGRVVETGIHKLSEVGFNPNKIIEGEGSAPVAPIHPKSDVAMGITNDMILYGGDVRYKVSCKTDDEIMNIIDRVPSISSRDYGKPFYEIFKAAGRDFYKIDPGLFAPAKISITNVNTGSTFEAGKINPNILKQSINLIKVNG